MLEQSIELKLTIDETNQILEALGQMPFIHVHQLVANIQQQAQLQLSAELFPNNDVPNDRESIKD